jgi:uncharacterized membrane protein
MLGYQFHGMNLFQFVIWFFAYSFLGWAMECIVIRREKGHWENRGFAKLPFCVIYGFGSFMALNIFTPIQDSWMKLFIACAIGATIFEYITALIMNHFFGEIWWDYNNKKFNYKGVICLESTIGWGLIGLLIFGFLNSRIENFVLSLNGRFVSVISLLLVIAYMVDFTRQFKNSYEHDKKGAGREA